MCPTAVFIIVYGTLESPSDHQGGDKGQDGVELRQGRVDECIGQDIVSLGEADDTVGADLTLADGRDEADKADSETDTEQDSPVSGEILAEPHQECHETVEALCGRKCRKDHITCRFFRVLLQGSFSGIAGNGGSDAASYSGKPQHQAEAEITKY